MGDRGLDWSDFGNEVGSKAGLDFVKRVTQNNQREHGTLFSHPPASMDSPWQEWLFYYIAASGDTVTESASLKKTLFQECSGQEGLINQLEQAMGGA
eukprot:4639523-Amphidinium_carterae.1